MKEEVLDLCESNVCVVVFVQRLSVCLGRAAGCRSQLSWYVCVCLCIWSVCE